MKIRDSLYSLLWGLSLLLAGGCSIGEDTDTPMQQGIVLYFSPQGSETRSNTEAGTQAENSINDLSLWFFATGASDNSAPVHCFTFTNLTSTEEVAITISEAELEEAGIRMDGIYDIYAAANISGTVPTFATLSELSQYTYTATQRPSSPFAMSGVISAHDFSTSRELSVSLLRQAVKLNITLFNETSSRSWSINSVSVSGDQKTVWLFEPGTATTPVSDAFADVLSVSASSVTDSPALYSAYIYENLSATPTVIEVNATIGDEVKNYRAEIKPEGLAKLVRNSVCSVTLRLQDETIIPTDIEVVMSEWIPGGIPEINISDTYLFLGTNTVEVFPGDGGFLDIDTDAEIVHVDMTDAPGFFMVGHEDETEFDLPIKSGGNTSTEFLFKFLGGSTAVIPNGRVTVSAGNIHKEITLTKSINNLIFEVRTVKMNGVVISRGQEVSSAIWNKTGDGRPTIEVIAYSNITWGGIYNVFFEPIVWSSLGQKSIYNGTPGESTTENPIVMDSELKSLAAIMPLQSKVLFYINSASASEGGVLIDAFEFTLVK